MPGYVSTVAHVARIEDGCLAQVMAKGSDNIGATRRALERHVGLRFTNEAFTIHRR